jgi:hypothetical protein
MPQTTALFSPEDLTNWLRQPVSADAADVVERVVWGWLRPLLNLTERPATPSDELTAWAIELGGIAYSNPEGLSSYSLESESTGYSSERRDELLRAVATGGTAFDGAVPAPRGSFPTARRYPDPAEPCW